MSGPSGREGAQPGCTGRRGSIPAPDGVERRSHVVRIGVRPRALVGIVGQCQQLRPVVLGRLLESRAQPRPQLRGVHRGEDRRQGLGLGQGAALLGRHLAQVELGEEAVDAGEHGLSAPPVGTRRALGAVFILVGVAILTGFDKTIQTWILEHSPITPWDLDKGFIPE